VDRREPKPLNATAPDEAIALAVAAMRAGEAVVYPTETFYGIGVDAFAPAALERIFAIKGRDAAKTIFSHQRIDGYMFDVEILRLARLMGYRIKEVGVRWRDDGDSRYSPISGTIKNARELMRIRLMRYGELPQGRGRGV